MYDEVEYKVNWAEKFKKGISIVLIVFLIGMGISLIVSKISHKPNYFDDNLKTMTSVARNYYKENNNAEKLTLKDMVNKKMLIEFVDENGEYCDINNSYAKVNNNKVEVYLQCSTKKQKVENYI